MAIFKGAGVAIVTPMYEDGKVNYDKLEELLEFQIANSTDAIIICGTTGESHSLTTDERKVILAQWIKSARKRFKVIAHVGSNCQLEAMELARHAQEVEADAFAAMAPCFFKPSSVKDLVDFFTPIAQSAPDLPFYYYNMPSMTGVSLSVRSFLIEGKKTMPNLVGTKFTHNNLMEMGECLELNNGEFEVLHGYDEILIAGLALGAVAGVGSTYNYLPVVYQNLFDAFKKGDICTARRMQQKSIEIVKIIIKYGGGVRGGKAIMNLIGVDCGRCRLPITPFGDDEYSSLKRDLEKIGFLN